MKALYPHDHSYANMRARLRLLPRVRLQAVSGQSVSPPSLLFPALPSLPHLYVPLYMNAMFMLVISCAELQAPREDKDFLRRER